MDNIPQPKRCTKCGVWKPTTEFHKNKSRKDGLCNICKPCNSARVTEWQRNNRDKAEAKRRRYIERNRERVNERTVDYQRRNADMVREWRKRGWERRRERVNFTRRKRPTDWRPMSKSEIGRRYYERHKDAIKERSKYWNISRAARRAAKFKRRGLEANAAGRATAEQIQARIDYYGGRCWLCGKEHEEVDHVIALNRGGSNWPANLRPICKSCNSAKRDKDWKEFAKTDL